MTSPPPPTGSPRSVERAHPLTPLIRGWVLVGALLISWGQDSVENGKLLVVGPILLGAFFLGIAGAAASWWTTRFVIDDVEVRVESGIVFRRSRRVSYRRVQAVDLAQPLVARLLRLAEVRVEVAGGGSDSRVTLRYLPLAKAFGLRTELLARTDLCPPDLADRPEEDRPDQTIPSATLPAPPPAFGPPAGPVVRVPAARLVGASVISVEFLFSALGALACLLLWQVWGQRWAAPLAVTAVLSTLGLLRRRVVAQYGFTIEGDTSTLRIQRGLTAVSAQSIPVSRIQAVRLDQPLTWRPFGWWRAQVTVAGYGNASEHRGVSDTTLVPVADASQLAAILALALPDVEVGHPWRPVDRRAFCLAPLGWRFMAWYAGPLGFATRSGWLVRTISEVPFDRAQSASVHQGPLRRRLGIATLHMHVPPGPVTVVADALPPAVARRLLSRMSAQRPVGRTTPPPSSEGGDAPAG